MVKDLIQSIANFVKTLMIIVIIGGLVYWTYLIMQAPAWLRPILFVVSGVIVIYLMARFVPGVRQILIWALIAIQIMAIGLIVFLIATAPLGVEVALAVLAVAALGMFIIRFIQTY